MFSFHITTMIIILTPYIINILRSRDFNIFCNSLKNPNPDLSSTFKYSKKYSSIFILLFDLFSHRIIKVICSWWFTSGVQSRITKKMFCFFNDFYDRTSNTRPKKIWLILNFMPNIIIMNLTITNASNTILRYQIKFGNHFN